MQLSQTCINVALTDIKLVKLLQDRQTLLNELLNTFKIDKINSKWSKNDHNMHTATIKFLELASYTHIACEILTG